MTAPPRRPRAHAALGLCVSLGVSLALGSAAHAQTPEDPEAPAPESPTPEAQTPEAQTPEAQTPEAQTPEAQTPPVTVEPVSAEPLIAEPGAEDPEAAPVAAGGDVFIVIDRHVSDDDVIRWAAQELAGARAPAPLRAPLPPEPYLAASRGRGAVILEPEPALRILAEVGGGALGVLLGGTAGALIVWAVLEAEAIPQVELGAVAGAVVLGALGVSSGVTLGADATGGRGNFGHAFIGQILGAAVALPVVVWGLSDGELGVGVLAAAVLPLVGGVLGYELGHADAGPQARSAFVVPVRDGALAGLSGSLD